MKNFLIGVVITLLIITSTASILVVNKLNDIQSSIEDLKVATELLEDNLNKKVHIKSDKLDTVLNDFMINAFNAANQELINKNK
ncbi:MAG: hypothetical protein CBD54_002715 [Alphaproteobacteria bacterium TMED194]|nr:MAG: hypothetical protein CBD54_002715 [Alphaproteobacteria bacterium TMED194]